MEVTAASPSDEVGRCRRRFWALPVIEAARQWYKATREVLLPISISVL